MRTSLNEIKEIEAYLDNTLTTAQRLFFEARMIINPALRQNVVLQKKVYAIVKFHFRNNLKAQFNALHVHLFEQPANAIFKHQVKKLFER